MSNKPWPKDKKECVSFYKITEPILEAVRFAYNLERKNKNKSIPWNGLDIGDKEKAGSFSPTEKLRAGNLKYSLEDQGRDALEEIIGLAVQLGIEQGRRIGLRDLEIKIRLQKHITAMKIRELLEEFEDEILK